MNRKKFDFFKKWICLIVLFLCIYWIYYPAESALITENVEALTMDETEILKICNQAGGWCIANSFLIVDGISMDFD